MVIRKIKEVNHYNPFWAGQMIDFDIMPIPKAKPTEVSVHFPTTNDKKVQLETLRLVRELQVLVDPDLFPEGQWAQGDEHLQMLEKELAKEATEISNVVN
jgi:hypothetical protein